MPTNAFVDATTLSRYFEYVWKAEVINSVPTLKQIPWEHLKTSLEPLEFLTRLVTYDTIYFDPLALTTVAYNQVPKEYEGMLVERDLDDDQRQDIDKKALESLSLLKKIRLLKPGEEEAISLDFFENGEKNYHDNLFEHSRPSLADSTNSEERAFYYFQLVNTLKYSGIISPLKQKYISELELSVVDRFKQVDRELGEPLNQEDWSTQLGRTPGPPLLEMIWDHALKKDLTLLDAAIDIRHSEEAIAFRRWIGRLHYLYGGSGEDINMANSELAEMQSLVESWVEQGNFDYNVRFAPVRETFFNLIPGYEYIGRIIEKVWPEKWNIILNKDKKALFIASMYKA